MNNNTRIRPRKIIGDFLSKPQDTRVVARTTDAFVAMNKDTRAVEDAKLIQGLVGTAVKVGGDIYQENSKEDAQKGKQDALLGKEMDPNEGLFHSTKAYTESYHGTKDEAQGIRLRDEYLTILRENDYFMSSPDPKAQQNSIFESLYGKYFGEDYLNTHGRDGMLTDRGLARVEEAQLIANSEMSKRGIEYRKEGFINDSYTLVSDVVDTMMETGNISADVVSASIDSNYEDYVRENGYLISKPEYQSMMLTSLGQKAIEKARLGDEQGSLKMVQMLKGLRDREGVLYERIDGSDAKTGKMSSTFKNMVDNIDVAVAKELKNVEKVKDEAEKKAREKLISSHYVAMSDIHNAGENPMERHEQVSALRDRLQADLIAGKVDYDKGKTLLDKLDKMYQQKGYIETNPVAYRSAIEYINDPNATLDGFIKTYGDYLEDSDFFALSNKLNSNIKRLEESADKTTLKLYKEYYADVKKSTADTLKVNTIFRRMDKFENDRVRVFNLTYSDSVAQFIEDNGKNPTRAELVQISESAKKIALTEYPMRGGNSGNTSKQSVEPKADGGDTSKESTPNFKELDRK